MQRLAGGQPQHCLCQGRRLGSGPRGRVWSRVREEMPRACRTRASAAGTGCFKGSLPASLGGGHGAPGTVRRGQRMRQCAGPSDAAGAAFRGTRSAWDGSVLWGDLPPVAGPWLKSRVTARRSVCRVRSAAPGWVRSAAPGDGEEPSLTGVSPQDFLFEDMESLTEMLRALATDGNKHRAKVDKRRQRSVFRDVLRAVEDRDFPTETVKFGPERMYIDCWVKKHTYDTFKEVLGSGLQYHLQSNEFLRHVFELGPPVMLDAAALKTMKISRFERHLYNSAAFKARTKARSKCRDKRADVGEFF